MTKLAISTSQDGEVQPAKGNEDDDHDDDDGVTDNVYAVVKEEPIYGNLEMLY